MMNKMDMTQTPPFFWSSTNHNHKGSLKLTMIFEKLAMYLTSLVVCDVQVCMLQFRAGTKNINMSLGHQIGMPY